MKFLRLRMFLVVTAIAYTVSLNLFSIDRDQIEEIEEFDVDFLENEPPTKFDMIKALRSQRRYARHPYSRPQKALNEVMTDDIEEFDSSQPSSGKTIIIIDDSSDSDLSEIETPDSLSKNHSRNEESLIFKLRSQASLMKALSSRPSSSAQKSASKTPDSN